MTTLARRALHSGGAAAAAASSSWRGETHVEERDVVVDEVPHHRHLPGGLALGLEEAGGEDGRQPLTGHLVELGALLDPGGGGGGGG